MNIETACGFRGKDIVRSVIALKVFLRRLALKDIDSHKTQIRKSLQAFRKFVRTVVRRGIKEFPPCQGEEEDQRPDILSSHPYIYLKPPLLLSSNA